MGLSVGLVRPLRVAAKYPTGVVHLCTGGKKSLDEVLETKESGY